jgi:hypothetical protein
MHLMLIDVNAYTIRVAIIFNLIGSQFKKKYTDGSAGARWYSNGPSFTSSRDEEDYYKRSAHPPYIRMNVCL